MQKITSHQDLEKKAYEMRAEVIRMLAESKSGHVGGALGMADIFTYLYFNFLEHNPQNPDWDGRDYFLLSNGHICPIWYAVLAHTGYFPVQDLGDLRKLGSHLQGHPLNTSTPGVFNSSGPLGHGEAQAVGLAWSLKLDKKQNRVILMMSDGEQQEGAVWESALAAAKYKLNNLTFILDLNGIQIDGRVEQIMPLPDMAKVYKEIGWNVVQIDAHNYEEIENAFTSTAVQSSTQPNIIIANSVPGKGVDFMENDFKWHDWRAPEADVVEDALEQLQAHVANLSEKNT